MLGFGKKTLYPIGIDIGRDGLRLAQLAKNGKDLHLLAGDSEQCPEEVDPSSPDWQHWIIESLRHSIAKHGFKGKVVKAILPADSIYIDHLKIPKQEESTRDGYAYSRIKNKLPFKCGQEETMVHVATSDREHAVVIAAEREMINRHLAIYEKVGLDVSSISVWPDALVKCYIHFFGRRQSDVHAVVLLINIEASCTNVVICRHSTLLFARSIPIGADALVDENAKNRLVLEVSSCRRDYAMIYKKSQLTRLIFMSGPVVETEVYASIAKQMEIQAQIGDCLVAVEMPEPLGQVLDRRDQHVSWATAFGLSLS